MNEIKIKSQAWASENFNEEKYQNGDLIPVTKSSADWVKFSKSKEGCYAYLNFDSKNSNLGKYYNGYAILDKRGLAPEGWRIPSAEDFETLKNEVMSHDGDLLNLLAKNAWDKNFKALDSFKFSAKPSGICNESGQFKALETRFAIWSSTKVEKYLKGYNLDTYIDEDADEKEVTLEDYNYDLQRGLCIRLIKE